MLREIGFASIVKSGVGETILTVSLALWKVEPKVALMEMMYKPNGVELVDVTVRTSVDDLEAASVRVEVAGETTG